MISYLEGLIGDLQEAVCTVHLKQGDGVVGYLVRIPSSAEYGSLQVGARAKFFISTQVREDAFDLYGFLSVEEREVFLALLEVNGIGPKGALNLLSKLPPFELLIAVEAGDEKRLTQFPGVGKKTAERIVMDLKDRIKKRPILLTALQQHGSDSSLSATSPRITHSDFEMASEALKELGYREPAIREALLGIDTQTQGLEDILRLALQLLSKPKSPQTEASF